MTKIKKIKGRQVFDSRGNPTVEAEVFSDDGKYATAIVPSGASVGTHEAFELRDKENKNYLGTSVLTAVKNINLLPNRDAIRQQNKLKFLSGFAFKGVAAAVAGIYLILIVLSFFQYNSNKEKLLAFDQVQTEFNQLNKDFTKLVKKKREMQKSLDLGKMINSNQSRSYRSLAQVTRSVPQRVQFTKITYDGSDSLIIEGVAFSDQDILNFISNLNAKSLIEQASLVDMKILTADQNSGSSNKKGFVISCKLKVT